MRFKVGDRVKFVKDIGGHTNDVRLGEIYRIIRIDGSEMPYQVENKEWFKEEEIVLADYTYEDLKKSPIGTKLTFENGSILTKIKRDFYTNGFWDVGDEVLKDNYGGYYLGKIIKIEEPTYSTVYEYKPEILDEVEKRYLRGVIRPFRDKVKTIRKTDNSMNGKDNEYLTITLKEEPNMDFPDFKPNTMYKGMKLYKEYTLEELGL